MPKLSKSDQAARVSQNEARRRKEVALARVREMEAYEKAGKLLPARQAEMAWSDIRAKVKSAVLRLPDRCAPQLAPLTDPRDVCAALLVDCEAILADEISTESKGPHGFGGRY